MSGARLASYVAAVVVGGVLAALAFAVYLSSSAGASSARATVSAPP